MLTTSAIVTLPTCTIFQKIIEALSNMLLFGVDLNMIKILPSFVHTQGSYAFNIKWGEGIDFR